MENPFQNIRNTETPDKSGRWYQEKIRQVGLNDIRPSEAMKSDIGEFVGSVEPGDMYLFMYDPKTKEKLPYYDTAPLVMVFDVSARGFHGINFHYLAPLMRMQLLGRMLDYTTPRNLSDETKFALKWNTLKNASRFPGVKPSVKQYLNGQIRSRILKINPQDWKKTIMLPIGSFEKKSRLAVFRDSRSKMQ